MEIIYKTGNLLDATENIILHGCNQQGVMGSGVAKVLRDKWPEVYINYRTIFESTGLVLGEIYPVRIGDITVINAITQENYGRDGKRYAKYHAIISVFEKIEQQYSNARIALPRIGAGLGGGQWSTISEIIETTCITVQPVVYIPEGESNGGK